MMAWLRLMLLKAVTPALKATNTVHLPNRRITSGDYRTIKDLLKPGMIFLTRSEWNLTNLFIPGTYKHGAIYAGENAVIEALGEGVVKTDLIDFLLTKDHVCVMTPLFADVQEMADAAAAAGLMVGSPYDYEFRSGNKAFYCFEVIYASYREARLKRGKNPALDWDLREFWGEATVVGDDFLKATKKWSTVWVG